MAKVENIFQATATLLTMPLLKYTSSQVTSFPESDLNSTYKTYMDKVSVKQSIIVISTCYRKHVVTTQLK